MSETLLPPDYPERFSTWTRLLDDGEKERADDYYFDSVMPAILPVVKARSGELPKYGGLISLLSFAPETTVLACHLLKPEGLGYYIPEKLSPCWTLFVIEVVFLWPAFITNHFSTTTSIPMTSSLRWISRFLASRMKSGSQLK